MHTKRLDPRQTESGGARGAHRADRGRPLGVASTDWAPMRRFAPKALFALLTLNKGNNTRFDWGRMIAVVSTLVTIGLVALYVYEKLTGRW